MPVTVQRRFSRLWFTLFTFVGSTTASCDPDASSDTRNPPGRGSESPSLPPSQPASPASPGGPEPRLPTVTITAEQARAALVELFRTDTMLDVQADLMSHAKPRPLDDEGVAFGPWNCSLRLLHFGAVIPFRDDGAHLYEGEFARNPDGAWVARITSRMHARGVPKDSPGAGTNPPN